MEKPAYIIEVISEKFNKLPKRKQDDVLLHELAHIFETDLSKSQAKRVLNWSKEKEWNTDVSEKFARGFEKYLSEGKAPNKDMKVIFEQFKEWLEAIYRGIIKHKGEINLNNKMPNVNYISNET